MQDGAKQIVETTNRVYDKLFPSGISDPNVRNEVRAAIMQSAIDGDSQMLATKVKELTGKKPNESELEAIRTIAVERDFAKLKDSFATDEAYQNFAKKYTLQTGIFFDGTGNNANDPAQIKNGELTNVARMSGLYESSILPKYIEGIGTSGGLDTICQGIGCGIDSKQQKAKDYLMKITNMDEAKTALFLPIDIVDFSRGATTGADFINKINNENYWDLGIMPRSHLMFDPTGSYGIPGNGVDLGKDFSTPNNVIAIQINAGNETRNLFDSQSLYLSNGQNPNPNNWLQITLPGAHSDIGGGYADGYQGKSQDMALYSMGLMIDKAQEYGINFKEIPSNQQPSAGFNQLMDRFNQAQTNLQINPSQQNQSYFNAINATIKDAAVHDSTIQLNEFWKLYNYSIGSERGVYYPNDKYLNNLTTLNKSGN